ncbi:CHC2 zinc finger domain-containing protein [Desulfococcus multivorans]|uniref:p4 alpha zinc-binding domain protein n=1 Tax=Desulfococcus multivorans DSM 2059 TaxID=1121405 RepID=S7U667_DESML|nr:CHC2 zinc finger domain-containing protein [Desulfococcus multivorans]AOY59564.1 phage P4 alpha zinc-binding domain protein [Desulfococcus multivorans]AQV01756.1 P4 alpha zinc-binding domain protein [Desulfococcus multivorans]EPR44590.1 P4 alpha zinc-binding domain protein [Desulfococcus multivorans DSM 2059]SKA20243.1 Toprim-like [Desulfococcus multivorans DSM 2059]
MDLQSIIQRDGFTLKREAGTNGGELAGPCPFCGGEDRFRVWPEKGRYWCRQCRAGGDAIQYLREREGMTYREACAAIGVEPKNARSPARQEEPGWLSVEWQTATWALLEETRLSLQWYEPAKNYLKGRGLNDETISMLGYNPTSAHMDRAAWGLPNETNPRTGGPKRVWIPRGIVIPNVLDDGLIHRLRIRLPPDEFERSKEWTNGKGIKYAEIPGSGPDPLLLPGRDGAEAWAVVESELDAYLIHQEAGDLVNVLGLGSTTARPTVQMLQVMAGKRVLLCLDHDAAGWRATDRLPGEYWPVPEGKDPGEYHQAGGDIRAWIEARLKESVASEAHQEAREPIQNDDAGEIKEDKGPSLPCGNPEFRCYHLRGGQCFYKSNWGPIAELDRCPMIYGLGHGEAHPDLDALERQRTKHGLDPELMWIYGGAKHDH